MDSDAIEEAAAGWLAKRASEAWTQADQAQFDAWLAASTAHRVQYLRLDTAWRQSARLKALGAGIPAGMIPVRGSWGDTRFLNGTPPEAGSPPAYGDRPNGLGVAAPQLSSSIEERHRTAQQEGQVPRRATRGRRFAVAAALFASAVGIYILSADLLVSDHYSTPVGGIDTVALNDGSHVILNTDSRIRVDLRDRERHIALSKGEAFFEVAKDVTRPFVVEVGDKRVIAVGTKFSVRREGADIRVVVTEGKVRVETNASPRLSAEPLFPAPGSHAENADAAIHEVFLTAGSIARTAKDEVLVRHDTAPEAEKLLSWRNGYVKFDDMTLADAVAEFNRYNVRKIVVADPAIAAIRIGGNFRSNNTDGFLALLQSGFPITVEQAGDTVVLRGQ